MYSPWCVLGAKRPFHSPAPVLGCLAAPRKWWTPPVWPHRRRPPLVPTRVVSRRRKISQRRDACVPRARRLPPDTRLVGRPTACGAAVAAAHHRRLTTTAAPETVSQSQTHFARTHAHDVDSVAAQRTPAAARQHQHQAVCQPVSILSNVLGRLSHN